MAGIAGITALAGALKGLISFGGQVVDMASHFEQTQKGLETVLQSASKGKAMFEDLRKFSFQTTFGVDELASASQQLLNVGRSSKVLKQDLKMLGDLAQGDKTKFAELTTVFSKIISTGKAGSMQLQQLALRGIPINKTLEEMGVKGVASADQITEAFKRLTEEGGQFHDAMQTINDTIEGKRGFISDTLKEIAVNFGEVSGITDTYRGLLDILYNALNGFNEMLMKINENPFLKALVTGIFTTAIVSLTGVLAVGLVGALKTVSLKLTELIAKETVLNALKGPMGWLTLGVGAVTGVVAGIMSYNNSMEEAQKTTKDYGTVIRSIVAEHGEYKEVIEETTKAVKTLNEQSQELYDNGQSTTYIDELSQKYKELSDSIIGKEAMINSDSEYISKDAKELAEKTLVEIREQYEQVSKELEHQLVWQRNALTVQESLEAKEQQRLNILKQENEAYQRQLQTAQQIYESTNKGKKESLKSQIAEYQNLLDLGTRETKTINTPAGIITQEYFKQMNKADKDKVTVAKAELQKQLNSIERQENIDWKKSNKWANTLYGALNMSDDDIYKTALNGSTLVSKYIKKLEDSQKNVLDNNKTAGVNEVVNKKDLIEQNLKEIMAVYNAVNNSGEFTATDKTMIELKNQLDKYTELFLQAGGTQDETKLIKNNIKELQENTEALKEVSKSLGEQFIDQIIGGSEIGKAKDNYSNNIAKLKEEFESNPANAGQTFSASNGQIAGALGGGIWEMFLSSLAEVITEIEGMDIVLNPIKNALKQLEPLLKSFFLIFLVGAKLLEQLTKWIMDALNWLTGGIFTEMSEMWDNLVSSEEEHERTLEEVNEQYKSLISSMREQEEYYISMKKQINSDTYKDSVYSVNDMILTPNGTFSTHPEDTIMAMKHPEQLMGSSVSVQINNNMSESANVTATQGADGSLIVNISKKIASDVARGVNGWDSALQMRQDRLDGRSAIV